MRIDGPQVTSSLSLNGTTITDLNVFVTTGSLNGITGSYATTGSLNSFTSSATTRLDSIETSTSSLNSFTSSANNRLNSVEGVTGSYATTGSNLFKGNQTISGSVIPAVDNTYDLGSTTHQFRDLYLSSASLYIDGTKVLSSTTQELQITTDTGQSFKILEAGSDTITLQSADGNITLATSGGGDVILDPTTGVVALKGTTQVYAGNKVRSSDGNNIVFGDGLTVSGSVTITGFIEAQELRTTYISSSILYRSGSTKFGDELDDTHSFTGSLLVSGTISVPGSGLISGSSQILNGSGVFSGSVQVDVMSTTNIARLATTGSNVFSGTISASNLSGTNTGDQTLSGLGGIGGSGTNGRIPKWTSSTALGDSVITDNGTNVRVTNPFLSDSRLAIGTAGGDQTYASVFVGGAITTGTSQYAFLSDPQLAGTDNYALFANARIKANTAVTNTFGVYIPSAEKLSGASIENNYALYIANQTAGSTTNYSIYSSGGRNYFGDKVSIGSNTFFTVAQFLVNGGLSAGSSAIAQFNGFIRMKDQLIIHNDANTGLESYLQCTAANEITTLNLKTTNLYASGNLVTIGNWTTATTLQFHSANNSVGRINFYDANDTEGVYIKNTGVQHGGDLRFGARWDDDEDKVFFNLRQSSAGASYDARFGLNVDPTETFHVSSNGITASAPSKGWPVYDAELDTNARRFIFQTAGNGNISTAGQGASAALILGQYFDSRVIITTPGAGSSSPSDQGTGRGRDMMIKAGTADNTVGYSGGRLYLNGGIGYGAGGFNANGGHIIMQGLTGSGNVGINDTNPQTKLSINGANYIEMATFACTTAAASTIVSDNAGYVQFSNGTARHISNTSVFTAVTDGIQILKAGIVQVTVSQDITTAGTTGYVLMYIQKNKSTVSENLITNTNSQWDGINGVTTITVAANDIINFYYGGSEITSFDPNTWSNYSFIWASR